MVRTFLLVKFLWLFFVSLDTLLSKSLLFHNGYKKQKKQIIDRKMWQLITFKSAEFPSGGFNHVN